MKQLINLFFLSIFFLLTGCGQASSDPDNAILPDTTQLHNGDLIFRKGRSNLSRIITTIYPGEFSHTGMLYKENNRWYVIHASENDDNGKREEVMKVPLSQFTCNARAIGIARVNCPAWQTEAAVRNALRMAAERVPFDSEYNLEDHSKVYCTEMVYVAYKESGINLLASISTPDSVLTGGYLFPENLWNNTLVTPLEVKKAVK